MRTLAFLQVLVFSTAAFAQAEQATSEPPGKRQSTIGYASVAEAMVALKERSGVQVEVTKPDAWTIINEQATCNGRSRQARIAHTPPSFVALSRSIQTATSTMK